VTYIIYKEHPKE